MSDSENGADPPLRSSYTCPGELYSIPHSIHLARLAAFYTKCRECDHRFDGGHFSPRPEPSSLTAIPLPKPTQFMTGDGVRATYLNELDRNRAIAWGAGLAALLWEAQPMLARSAPNEAEKSTWPDQTHKPAIVPTGPSVVVGFDERPSSPDIVTGVVLGLRRMGCPVIDLGQTSLPVLNLFVARENASAGLLVTGAGCDPAFTGFELVGRKVTPMSPGELSQLVSYFQTGVGRQTRRIGSHHKLQGQATYEASLSVHFHALRPLRIVCGSSTRLLPRVLDRLFAALHCQLTHVGLSTRQRNLFDIRDTDLQRLSQAVVDGHQHLGVLIDEDQQHTAFVTEQGRLVTTLEMARLLMEVQLRENSAAQFVLANSWLEQAQGWLTGRDAIAIDGGETASELVGCLNRHEASLALSGDGRVWFRDTYPNCDAILVLAQVLQALSLSDAPFSTVINRISPNARH